jgi:nucleotide-binding universal stress UspA family protein
VINVIGSQPVSARVGSLVDGERKRQQTVLHEAQALLGERDVRMTPHKALGDPTSEIRTAAEKSGAGVIVVGRGNGVRRLIDGSVSARLVRRAPCDVLVVH